eukprot:11927308-Alexandrium_andersonii.AAC.1
MHGQTHEPAARVSFSWVRPGIRCEMCVHTPSAASHSCVCRTVQCSVHPALARGKNVGGAWALRTCACILADER